MKIKYLHSFGKFDINEFEGELPKMQSDQIMIKTKYCGICRSDIGGYAGWEEVMPKMRQGHEGLGVVCEVGDDLKDKVKVGDVVATWSDPAYADYYYAKEKEFTIVPKLHHKYILQPVASAINIADKTWSFIANNFLINMPEEDAHIEILLLGSGFMSVVIGQYFKMLGLHFTVVGNANKKQWEEIGIKLHSLDEVKKKRWKAIIDLTSKAENFDIISKELADLEALICYAATPYTPVTTNFFENCWNCHTFIMPSPRNSDFKKIMDMTAGLIEEGYIKTEFIWSKGYDRNDMNEVKQAFEDGAHRSPDYIRGFIKY